MQHKTSLQMRKLSATFFMTFKEKLAYHRQNKNSRLTIIGVLILIVIALLVFWWKAKVALIILVLLVSAFGIEFFDYDVDLGKLWETGSVSNHV